MRHIKQIYMICINTIKKQNQKSQSKFTMAINIMKEEQKKVNAQNAIILKSMNRKKCKFNFFTHSDHKRNKAEQKLYLLLNEEQKQDIKLICGVLGLNMDFFNYWHGRNHKIYMSNNNPIIWVILKAPADGIEPEGITIKTISEIEAILTPHPPQIGASEDKPAEATATETEEDKPAEATATEEDAGDDVEIIHKKTIEETEEALKNMTPAEKVAFAKHTLKILTLETPKLKRSKVIKKLDDAEKIEKDKREQEAYLKLKADEAYNKAYKEAKKK